MNLNQNYCFYFKFKFNFFRKQQIKVWMQSSIIQKTYQKQINPELQTYRNFTQNKKNHQSFIRNLSTAKKQRSKTKTQAKTNTNSKNFNIDSTFIDLIQQSQSNIKVKELISNQNFNHSELKNKSERKNTHNSLQNFTRYQKLNNTVNSRILKEINCLRHKPLFDNHQNLDKRISKGLPFQIYPEKFYQNKSLHISKQQRFQNLIEDMRSKYLNRLQEKIKNDKQIYSKICSFEPNINKQKSQMNALRFKQLFEDSKTKEEKKRINQIQKLDKQKKEVSQFKEIMKQRNKQTVKRCMKLLNTEKHKIILQLPLHKRVNEAIAEKKQLIQHLKGKYSPQKDKQKYLTQKQTKQLAKRLIDDYFQQKNQKQIKTQQKLKEEQSKTNTFKPLLYHNQLFDKNNNIGKNNLQKSKSVQNYTFKPEINNVSKLIANYLHKQNPQLYPVEWSSSQKFNQRLYEGNYIKKVNNLDKIQAEAYGQCTFEPQINEISKKIYYYGIQSEPCQLPKHKCPLPQSVIKQAKQLTFQPQINPQSKFMQTDKKQLTIKRNKEKSKQKLQKIQYLKEYKQLQECTFRPQTISTSQEWQKWKKSHLRKQKMNRQKEQQNKNFQFNYQVKGLDNFLNNCNRIQSKKLQVLRRTEEIFNFQKKYDERMRKQQKIILKKQSQQ